MYHELKPTKGLLSIIAASLALAASGCSSDETTTSDSVVSALSDIPDSTEMVASSDSEDSGRVVNARSTLEVSGTAPLLSEIDADNVDQIFWDGLIADINDSSVPAGAADNFYGETIGGPAGQGGCQMAQQVLDSFSRMRNGTMCYMKNIPTAESGVEVVTGDVELADVFNRAADDKLVKVGVTGGEGGDMDVFITIKGTNSAADTYQADLYFCSSGESDGNFERIVVTGNELATYSYRTDGSNETHATLTTDADGNITFDKTQDRTAISYFDGEWGTSSSEITIGADDSLTMYNYFSSDWGSNAIAAKASFSGSDAGNVSFTEGSYRGLGSSDWGDYEFDGSMEYQDDHYVAVDNDAATWYSDIADVDLTEGVFSGDAIDSPLSENEADCEATPDIEISMDFGDSAVAAIQASCEDSRFEGDHNYCWSGDVQDAQQELF